MAEADASNEPILGKRRSTRIVQAVPITVAGADALGQPFKERTSTVMVSCHGCKYHSKHYVPKHSVVELEIPRTEASLPPRTVKGQVIWVQRPRTVRELFQIGIEFDVAGNVWGIAFPPDDWAAAIAASEEAASTAPPRAAVPPRSQVTPSVVLTTSVLGIPKFTPPPPQQAAPSEKKLEIVPPPTAPPAQAKQPEKAPEPAIVQAKSDASETGTSVAVQAPPRPAPPAPAPIAMAPAPPSPTPNIAKEMEKLVAEARHSLHQVARHESRTAIAEELEATRAKVDLQLREAVEQAVQSSMTRVSAQALDVVMHQAASRAASVVEDARKATRQNVEEIDDELAMRL